MTAIQLAAGPWDGRIANSAQRAAAITVNSTATGARRRDASGSVTATNRAAAAGRPAVTAWSLGSGLTQISYSLEMARTAARTQSPHRSSHARTLMRITLRRGRRYAGPRRRTCPGLRVARAVYPGTTEITLAPDRE